MSVFKNQLAELLGTKNVPEQAQRIMNLMGMAQAPVVDVIVRFDARTGEIGVSTIGPDLAVKTINQILEAAKDVLHQKELTALSASKTESAANNPNRKEDNYVPTTADPGEGRVPVGAGELGDSGPVCPEPGRQPD